MAQNPCRPGLTRVPGLSGSGQHLHGRASGAGPVPCRRRHRRQHACPPGFAHCTAANPGTGARAPAGMARQPDPDRRAAWSALLMRAPDLRPYIYKVCLPRSLAAPDAGSTRGGHVRVRAVAALAGLHLPVPARVPPAAPCRARGSRPGAPPCPFGRGCCHARSAGADTAGPAALGGAGTDAVATAGLVTASLPAGGPSPRVPAGPARRPGRAELASPRAVGRAS